MSTSEFPELPSSRTRSSAWDHLAIVAAFALTLALFHVSDDPDTGKGSIRDGRNFALSFVAVAYYVGWLPSLWEIGKRRWYGSLVLPLLIVLGLVYMYFVFRTYYIQKGATVAAFFAHLAAVTFLSFRI